MRSAAPCAGLPRSRRLWPAAVRLSRRRAVAGGLLRFAGFVLGSTLMPAPAPSFVVARLLLLGLRGLVRLRRTVRLRGRAGLRGLARLRRAMRPRGRACTRGGGRLRGCARLRRLARVRAPVLAVVASSARERGANERKRAAAHYRRDGQRRALALRRSPFGCVSAHRPGRAVSRLPPSVRECEPAPARARGRSRTRRPCPRARRSSTPHPRCTRSPEPRPPPGCA